MNSENQKLTIQIFGSCLIITLAGIIIMAIQGLNLETINLFFGFLMTIVGILATFLTGKNMTEKQDETLEKYQVQKYVEKAINEAITPTDETETAVVDEDV